MKIITGFWTPTQGSVKVAGFDVVQDTLKVKEKIGYLPETVPLYDEMRVFEYLKFISDIRSIPKSEIKKAIKEVINDCGLEEVVKKPIEELSKGYRQRLGLAQAIIHQPDILILDEPTTGLDPNQIAEIRTLIKQIGQNKTVVFSTHILQEVSAVCDRAIIIHKGKIVGEGTAYELAQKAGAREIIYVKIKGPQELIYSAIKALEHVENVIQKDQESEEIFGYEIRPHIGIDIREHLSMVVLQNNWSILEFSKKSMSMEEVFRELTK